MAKKTEDGGVQTIDWATASPQIIDLMKDPAISLPRYGYVVDQKTNGTIRYDPYRITHNMQATIIKFFSDSPKTQHNQDVWLNVLKYRQGGASTTSVFAAFPETAWSPGSDLVVIADNKERAKYLQQRLHQLYTFWPDEVKPAKVPQSERNQMTFDPRIGGKIRVLSAEQGAVGIGQSPSAMVASEIPFWANADEALGLITPSMINRDKGKMLWESTPAPANAPSVEAWRRLYEDGKRGNGRWRSVFFPYWDGKLCARAWRADWTLTNDEARMMERYGDQGLQLCNLAFRRYIMDTVPEFRRVPELFNVYYPSDDVTCWMASDNAVLGQHLLERHAKAKLKERKGPYMEYEQPEAGAQYVIGVDPAGHAARDHASFQVLKVYEGEWTQVACYAAHTDPLAFTNKLHDVGLKYNKARLAIESNGVGQGTITLLRQLGYPEIIYEKPFRPGITSTLQSKDKMLAGLQDALLDTLELRDLDTLSQLQTYGHDKKIEEASSAVQLRGKVGKGRRERHHWDKVSALMLGIEGAREWMPRRFKPKAPEPEKQVLKFSEYSYNQIQEFKKQQGDTEIKDKKASHTKTRYKKRRRK